MPAAATVNGLETCCTISIAGVQRKHCKGAGQYDDRSEDREQQPHLCHELPPPWFRSRLVSLSNSSVSPPRQQCSNQAEDEINSRNQIAHSLLVDIADPMSHGKTNDRIDPHSKRRDEYARESGPIDLLLKR